MTKKQMLALKVGDKVFHKRYGFSTIKEVITDFEAVTVEIATKQGRELLANDSGAGIPTLLEDNHRLLKAAKVNKVFTYNLLHSKITFTPKVFKVFKDKVEVGTLTIGKQNENYEGSFTFDVEESELRSQTPQFDFENECILLHPTKEGFISPFESGTKVIEFHDK